MLKDYTIYRPTKKDVLFCADDQEMQNELQQPMDHYNIKKPVYMHTVLAEGEMFDMLVTFCCIP
eukprot:2998689-Ditylum_brightwellii.AAC.1